MLGGVPKKRRKPSKSRKKVGPPRKITKTPATRKSAVPVIKKRISKTGKPGRKSAKSVVKASNKPKAPDFKKVPPVKLSPVGEVTHYFDKIKVCVIRIDHGTVKKGDRLRIEGNKGNLVQDVSSMQIENEDVASARKGQTIGLKVKKMVYVGDAVQKM